MRCGECGFRKPIAPTPQASPHPSSPRCLLSPAELQSRVDQCVGKREPGLSYTFLCKSLVSAQPLGTAPRGTKAQHGPYTAFLNPQHGQVCFCPLNVTTRIERSVTSSVLRLEICPKKLPGVICAAREPAYKGWAGAKGLCRELRGKSCGLRWLWALLAENQRFWEQREAVCKTAEKGCEKLP